MEREEEVALAAAEAAGRIILAHRQRGTPAARAKQDGSPVTDADVAACQELVDRLRHAFPADAVVSEELPAHAAQATGGRVWWVDPLDGTRDFAQGAEEFSVHVGLAVAGKPVGGVVACPAPGRTYSAWAGRGAFRWDGARRTRLTGPPERPVSAWRLGISKTGPAPALLTFLEQEHLEAQAVRMAASVKFMALADGELDAVINLSRSEQHWDTCAPHVVLLEAGCRLTGADGSVLDYAATEWKHPHGSLAAPPAVHQELLRRLAGYAP